MERNRYLVIRVSLMAAVTVMTNLNSKNFSNLIKIIKLLPLRWKVILPLGNLLKINNSWNKETAHSQTK